MKLYLAGPMTGLPNFNFPAFDAGADYLRAMGFEVCNPADHDRDMHGDQIEASATGDPADAKAVGFSLRDALTYDLTWIAQQADGVALLPGWENSKGVRAEVSLAHALGLPVAPVDEWWRGGDDFDKVCIQPPAPKGVEVRTVSNTGGEKGVKPQRYDLIPAEPLRQLAEHYGKGAEKYADNQWRKGYEWSKSFQALQRHAWQWFAGETFDEETGSNHMAAVAWHAFALLQYAIDHPDFDDRPK